MHYFKRIAFNNDQNMLFLLDKDSSSLPEENKMMLFKSAVEIVHLEVSAFCNRKCNYCPVASSERSSVQRIMNKNLFNKVLQELKEIDFDKRISLNLYNEPLENPELEFFLKSLREDLPRVFLSFNSNGDRFNIKRLITLRNAGLNLINITLHPMPNKLDSAEKRLQRIHSMFKRLKFEGLDIDVEYIENNESLEFRHEGLNIRIQWINWNEKGSSRGGLLKDLIDKSMVRTQPCVKPFREFTIYHDGIVTPCCEVFHDQVKDTVECGDLNYSSIYEVYFDECLASFRSSLFDFSEKKGVCRNCNIQDLSQISDDSERKRILALV